MNPITEFHGVSNRTTDAKFSSSVNAFNFRITFALDEMPDETTKSNVFY